MEERGEVLDLTAARPQLELAAAVDRDPVLGAVVVEVEEAPHRAETRRLRVEADRRECERLDVLDRVDREVPGDPVAMRLEHRIGLLVQARILEPGVRKRAGDAAVELGGGGGVDPFALVEALQVDDVDGAGGGELGHDLVGPGVAGVELEADSRGDGAPAGDVALGDDEADGLRLAADCFGQREAVLAQGEVERRRLESPGPVARLVGDEGREGVERVLACRGQGARPR